MMPTDEVETTGAPEQPQDELFEEAKALVVEMQTASISPKRFRIGYNRAARLVDELKLMELLARQKEASLGKYSLSRKKHQKRCRTIMTCKTCVMKG